MAYRRRFRGRSRRGGMRWLAPNTWTASNPNFMGEIEVTAPADEIYSDLLMVPLISGAAPFQGAVNATGLLAGKTLAERMYFKALRIVGRLEFHFGAIISGEEVINMPLGGVVSVHWGILRLPTTDQGVPLADTMTLVDNDDQDEKKYIVTQDVWRTVYPVGTALSSSSGGVEVKHSLAAAPPLYSLVDTKVNRWVGNEQQLFLAAQVGLYAVNNNFSAGDFLKLYGNYNLRTLVKFGR